MRGWAQAATLTALLALAAGFALPARAQPPEARQQAGALFQKAVAFYEAGDYASALVSFRAAYDAAPSWEVLWNIGLCQRRLFQYGDAVATFEAYLKEGGKRLTRERRAAVEEELARVRALTAAITVRAPGGVAEVLIDGERVGFTPLERHLVGPGRHQVRVEREGFRPHEQTRELLTGEHATLEVALAPLPGDAKPIHRPRAEAPPAAPAPAPAALARDPAPRPERPFPAAGVVLLGAGALFIGGGIALEVEARAVTAEIDRLYETGGTWEPRWVEREQWQKTSRALSVVSFVLGGGLLASGAVITALTLRQPAPGPAITGAALAPLPEGGVAATVGGTF